MMDKTGAGFREEEHTADWALSVWAPDLPGLAEQAARGMYWLSGTALHPGPVQILSLELDASDPESLLVNFLSEILYLGELEGIGVVRFQLEVSGTRFSAKLEGVPIASQQKEIKAVTYHNLAVRQGPQGLEATFVFDV